MPESAYNSKVSNDSLYERLGEYARGKGLRVVRPADGSIEAVTTDVSGFSIPIVVPFILCYREAQVSALLVRDSPAKGEEAAK